MATDVDAAAFDDRNPEPRCPCVLLLDTFGSMAGDLFLQTPIGWAKA